MKNSQYMLYTVGLALASTVALASPGEYEYEEHYQKRGPAPFEVMDLDKDGVVSKAEHETFREKRHLARIQGGYRMKNASKAPIFDQIDADANGSVSREEMDQWRAKRYAQRMDRMYK